MDIRNEQRAVIKFCIRLNKSGAEKVTLFHQAYQNKYLERSTIFRWHHAFIEGRNLAALTPQDGRPTIVASPINVNMVSVVIDQDHHLSTRKIAGHLNMTQSSVNRILRQHLQMQRVSSMWLPHLLTHKQMDTRLHLCEEALERIAVNPDYLDRVIPMDESWVHRHDPLTRQKSSHWKWRNEPR